MTSNWKEYKIEDLNIQVIDGDRGKNYPNKQELLNSGDCLFLSAQNVTKKGFNFSETQWITKEKDSILRNGKLSYGDIVITTRGTVGNVALYSNDIKYTDVRINSGMLIVRCDETLSNKYLYFVLSSDFFAKKILLMQSGTAQPQLPKSHFLKMSIPLPPLETQQKIAKVLSAIDDKIELNNSINNNLEQQAQAIFKSWFVDFEPFGGVMPDDWMYKELGDLGLDISDGNYSSKYPKTNEFVNTGVAFIRGTDFIGTSISKQNMYYITEKKHKELLKGHTKKDDLLITTRGEIGRIAFVPDSLIDVNINSQLVRINGNKILPKSYLACSLLSTKVQNDFKSLITGSALQQLPIGRLKKIILLKPSTEILNHFDKIVGNLLKVSDQNYEENEHLTQLRDTLLPKLMSGEIDVSKVEINEILEGSSDDKLSFSEK